jgi:SAM-dependent methyltransferase
VQHYIRHVSRAFEESKAGYSSLPPDVLAISGMSGNMTRHLYNNLALLKLPATQGAPRPLNYLEIGTWKGSSLVAAMYGNSHVHGVCIDNWSQFGSPRQEYDANIQKFLPEADVTTIEGDSFVTGVVGDTTFDMYLYDGGHTYNDHRRAITHFARHLADVSIVIIDDWNWPAVRAGTLQGLAESYDVLKVRESSEVRHTHDDSHTPFDQAKAQYWNGIVVMVIERIDTALVD